MIFSPRAFLVTLAAGFALLGAPALAEATCPTPTAFFEAATRHAECTTVTLLDNSQERVCHWAFPLRNPAATKHFNRFLVGIETCFGAPSATDPAVNHPDSFTLHQFETEFGRLALSMKDKSSLSQTLIFLHFAPPN